ncbi:MAG TPA: circadian clock KaiB family protein [Candidatus Acidoferrum sp.]
MKKSSKKTAPAGKRKPRSPGDVERTGSHSLQAKYVLRLYINGSTLKSTLAVKNIKQVCEQYLNGRYDLEIIDIYKQANLARDEQIVAVPTLIKRLPRPLRRLIGDLSDQDKVLFGLDLKTRE